MLRCGSPAKGQRGLDAVSGARHGRIALTAAPDPVGEAVILTGKNRRRQQFAGHGRGDFLDGDSAPRRKLHIGRAATDVNRAHLGADRGARLVDCAEVTVRLLTRLPACAKDRRAFRLNRGCAYCGGKDEVGDR